MEVSANPHPPKDRGVGLWLMFVCAFLAAIVLVGGLTRLTDSGLSITEWKPVTGMVPPLSVEDWQEEFSKYKQIPEYEIVNKGMSLDDFKTIFWWEWGHRFLARTVGIVFLVSFLYFLIRGRIEKAAIPRFVFIFVLGGAQGALGWFMVSSGLTERVDVSQYRLAAHLGLAIIIYGYIFWSALPYLIGRGHEGPPGLAMGARLLVGLVFLQIISGAFVAGIHAGRVYNTWPLMDGRFIPDGLFDMVPKGAAMFEDHLTAQFDHRMLAYVVLAGIAALVYAGFERRANLPKGAMTSLWVLGAVALGQVVLGILTLIHVVPIGLAAAHQLGALVLFTAMLFVSFKLSAK
ncbi:MAG: COX15/CtaA family protein [Alphaproteobacteria bacterium]